MKKTIRILAILLAIFFMSQAAHDTPAAQSPPDPYSGDLSNYEGTWIINGTTEEDTSWTLEIEYGEYSLYNEYQIFNGEVIFTPGHEEFGKPDTLCLDIDPELGVLFVFESYAGGLIEVSGQGLVFVRPGDHIEYDEAEDLEHYPRERMVGDWVLDVLWVYVHELDFSIELHNEDIMAGSITGDDRLILSFDGGILYQVSEELETRAPITRYLELGRGRRYFENPKPIAPYVNRFMTYMLPTNRQKGLAEEMVIEAFPVPPASAHMSVWLIFSRITSVDEAGGGT